MKLTNCIFLLLVIGFLGASSPEVRAQGCVSWPTFVADSSLDVIFRFEDLDGSGTYDADVLGEITVPFDPEIAQVALSRVEAMYQDPDSSRVFLLDGGTLDALISFEDEDESGVVEPSEIVIIYDNTGSGPDLGTPKDMLFQDGKIYICDDGSRAGHIICLSDLDQDGNSLGKGEAVVVFDSTNASGVVATDWESMTAAPWGGILVADTEGAAIYGLEDLDGDGLFLGPGEAHVVYDARGEFALQDIDAMATSSDGTVYVVSEDTGEIFAFLDVDGDRNFFGAGEARIFVSGPEIRDPNDMKCLPDSGLIVIDGSRDSALIVRDLDGDGIASGELEICNALSDGGETLSTPSAGFAMVPMNQPAEIFLRGDANVDGLVDISDAVAILEYLFLATKEATCLDAMDADDSGVVNISDPIYALNFLFLGGPEPRSPFPESGADPSEDELSCDPIT